MVFLQYLYGPRVRILPVLCGAFFGGRGGAGGCPRPATRVARFVGALGEIAARDSRHALLRAGRRLRARRPPLRRRGARPAPTRGRWRGGRTRRRARRSDRGRRRGGFLESRDGARRRRPQMVRLVADLHVPARRARRRAAAASATSSGISTTRASSASARSRSSTKNDARAPKKLDRLPPLAV